MTNLLRFFFFSLRVLRGNGAMVALPSRGQCGTVLVHGGWASDFVVPAPESPFSVLVVGGLALLALTEWGVMDGAPTALLASNSRWGISNRSSEHNAIKKDRDSYSSPSPVKKRVRREGEGEGKKRGTGMNTHYLVDNATIDARST